MGTLQDALKSAVAGSSSLVETPVSAPVGVALLPSPLLGPWADRLRASGVSLAKDVVPAFLVQKTAALLKDLERNGRNREARELAKLRDDFMRDREKKAWELVKARFAELDFPEKTYRALKQEGAEPERVLAKLYTRRAVEWQGLAAAKLRDQLIGK